MDNQRAQFRGRLRAAACLVLRRYSTIILRTVSGCVIRAAALHAASSIGTPRLSSSVPIAPSRTMTSPPFIRCCKALISHFFLTSGTISKTFSNRAFYTFEGMRVTPVDKSQNPNSLRR